MDTEVEAPQEYVYSWTSKHELSLDQFLSKYKPSMVQDDGTKPWIWVHKDGGSPGKVGADLVEAIEEAASMLEAATARVEAINNDASIPTRSNKKTGARSKKELREEVQATLTADLKKLAQEKGVTTGKWMFFAQPESVDGMWSRIASSLVKGDLGKTPAWLAKVSTSKPTADERAQHLICLYLPDLYDKAAATEVLKVLVGKVGLTPGSAKADLYTHIGIDSKHPSGVRSTVWQVKELLSEEEMQKLRDEYTAGQSASRSVKPKAATKRDDPFDDDETETSKPTPTKKAPTKRKDEFEDDDEDEKPAKKAKITSAPAKIPTSKKQEDSETEYEEDGDEGGAELVKKPARMAPMAPTSSTAGQKPGASRLGKIKAAKTKYDN
ncbi:hypothetical protein CALVIDRAFT_277182 [Calocera viscosa TUFC12733]|uniref:DUF1917-domain-containing protein n=1 Tax=Calocera viscosa (strain TUFC12733) TaxID=1330018 RepID=A0A167R2P2_CALVF|nr:hypothetical protein CALVIDRAFT_277182 [Calocera viscosa TUFC12733]